MSIEFLFALCNPVRLWDYYKSHLKIQKIKGIKIIGINFLTCNWKARKNMKSNLIAVFLVV